MKYSTEIYNVYLKYISPEDILIYSIDKVFCDITDYLNTYKMTPRELVSKMIQDVYDNTGITATAGIVTNMFLSKIAMGIVAKHKEPNEIGVRIAELDDESLCFLNMKLQEINIIIRERPKVSITYFIKDENKLGGRYETIEDILIIEYA